MNNLHDSNKSNLFSHLNSLNESRSYLYKKEWMDEVEKFCLSCAKNFAGSNVLEVGSGVHNPLGSLIIAYFLGANISVGVELGVLSSSHLDDAFFVAALCSASNHSNSINIASDIISCLNSDPLLFYNNVLELGSGSIKLFNSSYADVDLQFKIDISHSNAVLEHVLDFEDFIRWLRKISSTDSLHIHKVDFIDHNYYSLSNPSPLDAFRFLFKDKNKLDHHGCNRLRVDQMLDIIARNGFYDVKLLKQWTIDFPDSERVNLEDEYSCLPIESLSTIGAIVSFRG